jgi:hypothetical protein
MAGRTLLTLSLRRDGKLELRSTGNRGPAVFSKSNISKTRWTHVTLVHYPHRVSNPSIRKIQFCIVHWVSLRLTPNQFAGLFIDGVLNDTINWPYPKAEGAPQIGKYTIGDDSEATKMSWSMASSYMLSVPLGAKADPVLS